MGPVSAVSAFDDLEDRILPWSQVKVICGLSRTTVWRMQKTGDFPACVQVSRNRVGWWQSEILAWIRARTPRRLPEPRRIPEPSVPVMPDPPVPKASTPAEMEKDPVQAAPSTGGRKKKSAVAQNQTAFDFGG